MSRTRSEKLAHLIQQALGTRQAQSWAPSDLEIHPLPQDQHPGIVAIELVREALGQFEIPSRVSLTYLGMVRQSGHGQHQLRDGLIKVAAEFSSLSGHKHRIEVPVIVHDGHTVFPEIFVAGSGEVQVLAQSAFDEMLRRGNTFERARTRKNLYSPHDAPAPVNEVETVGRGMFTASRRTADHNPHGLDPAERSRGDNYRPGDTVTLVHDFEARLRGGTSIVYPAGTEVTVQRDMAGDGSTYYCKFPDNRHAPVNYADLSD